MIDLLESVTSNVALKIHRIVECQETAATLKLVDSLEEQALLESLLEESKPNSIDSSRHYLLTTPFRYPPLTHGSRFGGRFEPSLFYGSHSIYTMLQEAAFYMFYFAQGMDTPFEDAIVSSKTSFTALVECEGYADLTKINSEQIQKKLTDKHDYKFTQDLGRTMKEHGINAFTFTSARDSQGGLNMAVFELGSIKGKPMDQRQWDVKQVNDEIIFSCLQSRQYSQTVNIELFLVDGILPSPAS